MHRGYGLLTVLYCTGIFVFSSQPKPLGVDLPFPGADKVAHLTVYAGLAACVSLGIRRSGRRVSRRVQFLAPMVFASLYGVFDEVHQLFVPHRTFSMVDILADTAGATLMQGFLCCWVWQIYPLRRPTR